jgi:ethanolamine utilization protein EutA
LLGQSIREKIRPFWNKVIEPIEKIRATVIGAGNYSISLSGSTIFYDETQLPMKNIPVISITDSNPFNPEKFAINLAQQLQLYPETFVAISFRGPTNPAYTQVKSIASIIFTQTRGRVGPLIIIVQNDFAKALGEVLQFSFHENRPLIILDRINVQFGNYLDIGKPILGVVPVIIKTIIFDQTRRF